MANEKNLIYNQDLTPEERHAKLSMAGKASGKARREKRTLKEELLLLLAQGDTQERLSLALIEKAMNGDLKAFSIFENCSNLIRTIPALQYDTKNPNDTAKEPHELTHAPDALRYFCVYWTAAAHKTAKIGKYIPDLLEDWENSDAKLREIMEGLYGRPY